MSSDRAINIVAAALGGQGGAVFTNWLIDVAESCGWYVQTTSLAGVAQRTGATIYYIEMMPRDPSRTQSPVLSLFPSPGDIDIAICSELSEAGRMLQRGFITPDRTALITSSNRVFSINEKVQLGDGTVDPKAIADTAARYAKQLVAYDMQAIADETGSVISSVLLGAIAGAGVLPFEKDAYTGTIEKTGKAVKSSLAAFEAGYSKASSISDSQRQGTPVTLFDPTDNAAPLTSKASVSIAADFSEQIRLELPESTHGIASHGVAKTLDYQDKQYAQDYLSLIKRIAFLDNGHNNHELTQLCARYLALWMCFEDIPRVAQLKLRATRMAEIREEVGAPADQILYVNEYFRPRPEEICAIMPATLGEKMLASNAARKLLNFLGGEKKLRTNTVSIFLALRVMRSLRRFRRGSLGYKHEQAQIQAWLTAIEEACEGKDFDRARELAKSARLVKGYGDTRHRTSEQVKAIVASNGDAERISDLVKAAMADDQNEQFSKRISEESV